MNSKVLNLQQLNAVKAPIDSPLKISAGAGTGKTTVLVHRYHELLHRGLRVESILALTFTRKAAAEMRTRIFPTLPNPRDILKAQIFNFDAFFLSILTSHSLLSEIDQSHNIIQGLEQENLIKQAIKNVPLKKTLPAFAPHRIERFLREALNAVEKLRLNLIAPDSFKNEVYPNTIPPDFAETVNLLFTEYEKALRDNHSLDFPEITLRCHRLLIENETLRKELNRRYRYILVDEVQDTNPAQFQLLNLIADPGMSNVTAVGDDKQAIYGFRGAEINNLRDFKGNELPLNINYRSSATILELAHQLICQDEFFRRQENKIRLIAERKIAGASIFFYLAPDVETEAEFVATQLEYLLNEGISPQDIALLSRSKAILKVFEKALSRRNIPYRTIGGGYFDREEVKDIWALLKNSLMPGDKGSLSRLDIRNIQPRYKKSVSLQSLTSLPLVEALVEILKSSGYFRLAGSCDFPQRTTANIEKLLLMAEEFSQQDPDRTLNDFLDLLQQSVLQDPEEVEAEFSGVDAISLLTIHRAKGLEWKVVFIVEFKGPGEKIVNSIIYIPESKELILKKDPFTEEPYPEFSQKFEQYHIGEKNWGEEIRLQYVAVTRAKDLLFVVSQNKHQKPPIIDHPENFLPDRSFTICELDSIPEPKSVSRALDYTQIQTWQNQFNNLQEIVKTAPETIIDLNFTALRDYLQCPRYFWYRHHLQFEKTVNISAKEEISSKDDLLLGEVFHRLVAIDPQLKQDFANLINMITPQGTFSSFSDEFVSVLKELLENYKSLNLHKNEIIGVEKEFTYLITIDGGLIRFSGKIDRIELLEGQMRFLDFKTGKLVSDEHLREFRLQLSTYALAAKYGALGESFNPLLAIAMMREKKILQIEFQNDAQDIIKMVGKEVGRGNFPELRSNFCFHCDWRKLCPRPS